MNYQLEGDKQWYILPYFLVFIIALFLLYLAFKSAQKTRKFLISGLPVQATVAKIQVTPGSDGEGDYLTHILEFVDKQGNAVSFEGNPALGARLWRRGEEVSIVYDPENPYRIKIVRFLLGALWESYCPGPGRTLTQ